MHHLSRPLPTTGFALVLSTVLVLTGCTSTQQDRNETEAPTPPSTGAPQIEGQPEGVVGATTVPSDVPNDAKLRDFVSLDTCEAIDNGWSAAGTAMNETKDDATYDVTVFFTVSSGTVVGSGQTKVDVPAGETASWEIEDTFTTPITTSCVLRGVGAA
ncbi:hypothetical protein GCM10009561_22210 [Frigoribacterium faeni]